MAGRDHLRAKGRTIPRVAGRMNKGEAAYAPILEAERRAGLIVRWGYESVTLRLADRTTYTADFYALHTDGSIHLTEVKPGNQAGPIWTPDSRVKWKVAAEAFPELHFHVAWRCRGVWHSESADREKPPPEGG